MERCDLTGLRTDFVVPCTAENMDTGHTYDLLVNCNLAAAIVNADETGIEGKDLEAYHSFNLWLTIND